MKRRYHPCTLPPWLRKIRGVCCQFAIPFCIFQGIRTVIIPTVFDVLLLIIFLSITIAFYLELI